MTALNLDIEYNARKTVPDHEEISARWEAQAASYRQQAEGALDIPYGESERERYDFFPASDEAPICAYIHGGYWRSRDRKTFSHIAKGLNERGISVAIPSYNLVPNVALLDIIAEMRRFLAHLWHKTGQRPVVAGHSAGGHLAGAMLATDWGQVEGVPDDLVTRAFALSGLYDLRPLLRTDINDDVRLDDASAEAASPLLWPAPRKDLKFVAAVGEQESVVFREQSKRVSEVWNEAGIETVYVEVPGCNHFTIVDSFATPGGMLFDRFVSMVEGHAAG